MDSLAIAYNAKRAAEKKKLSTGGEVNEKLHPEHEPKGSSMMDKMSIARAIMKKKKMSKGGMADEYPVEKDAHYAEGGEVEGSMMHPDDDFLSDEEQTPYFHMSEDDLEPKAKRRGMLERIMSSLHSRHYGE